MLMSAVVLPEAFAKSHFEDPTYHLNTEILLRGIDANGLILVDAKGRLYKQLCDNVEQLAGTKKGKTTHALFEELLKKKENRRSFGLLAPISYLMPLLQKASRAPCSRYIVVLMP